MTRQVHIPAQDRIVRQARNRDCVFTQRTLKQRTTPVYRRCPQVSQPTAAGASEASSSSAKAAGIKPLVVSASHRTTAFSLFKKRLESATDKSDQKKKKK